ncbi:MAG: hypothetical protein BroJett024_29470 [Alphaproteobacteria bacterium]|nr:MAG: hypothetical protein BroJett024_29470 [Alphaproteobacteria bacterium]
MGAEPLREVAEFGRMQEDPERAAYRACAAGRADIVEHRALTFAQLAFDEFAQAGRGLSARGLSGWHGGGSGWAAGAAADP